MGMEGASLRCPSSLNKTTGGHETDRAAAVQLCLLCTSHIHGYKQSSEQRRGAGGAAGMLEERSSGFCSGMGPTAPSPGLDPPPRSVLHHGGKHLSAASCAPPSEGGIRTPESKLNAATQTEHPTEALLQLRVAQPAPNWPAHLLCASHSLRLG